MSLLSSSIAEPGAARQQPVSSNADGTLSGLARGGIFATAGTAVAAVCGFVLTLVITHGLSTRSAGVFFSCTAVYLVLQTFLSFGAGAGVVRFIPRLRSLNRHADIPGLLAVAIVPVIAVSVLGAVALWCTAGPIASRISAGDPAAAARAIRTLALVLAPGVVEVALVECTRGFGSIRKYVLLQQLFVPGSRPLLLLLAAGSSAPLWVAVLLWATPLVVAAALAGAVTIAAVRGEQRRSRPDARPATPLRELAREYWGFTGARGLASIMEILLTWLDVLLVATLVSPAAAAVYAAASRFVTSGTLVLSALRLVLAPDISGALARGELVRVGELHRTATGWVMLTSWPAYLLMAVSAPVMLRIFGAQYPSGATALSVLSVAMLVALAVGNVNTVLLMSGHSLWVLANKGGALAVNVVGNVLLTPRFGITGAALAWAAAIVVDNGLAALQVRNGMKIRTSSRTLVAVAIAAAGCFGVVPLLIRLVAGATPAAVVAGGVLGTLLYLPIVWRLRAPARLDLLRGALRRGRRRAAVPPAGLNMTAALADGSGRRVLDVR